eukprot:CAMPEP_0113823280 /NCGR_PEP_ID=MMETSP0328-20130328/2663_1 /TAXON_ID=39455 /ORGANISM="Alexandrium minutum" /LENGTH=121 /DNA_ID=CAMNT_0000791219 /DNA_START=63 /DNA_END=428 /DNA_ORIENTATION=- /assembly_acc=CAM_ASM_000350
MPIAGKREDGLDSPWASLGGDLQDVQDRARRLVQRVGRVGRPLVVAVIQEDLLPLVRVGDLPDVHSEPQGGCTNEGGGGPEPSVHVGHEVVLRHRVWQQERLRAPSGRELGPTNFESRAAT